MNSIIMICDDPRIGLVKEFLQPLLNAKVCIVSDFDSGLEEVFEKRPQVVFIQDEIAGVKGKVVIRHITSLLQENSPQFVQLHHPVTGPGIPSSLGDGINLDVTDEELVALFKERMEQFPQICWKEDVMKPARIALALPAPDDFPRDEPFSFVSPSVVEPVSRPVEQAPPLEPSVPSRSKTPGSSEMSVGPELLLATQPAPEGAAMKGGDSRESSSLAGFDPPPPRRRVSLAIGGGVAALVCGTALSLFFPTVLLPRGDNDLPRHPIPVSAPVKQLPVASAFPQKLPSFIPREGFDPAYGANKRGWERYVSPRLEYLIYRENGSFRALQVIALQQEAIDPPLVSSLLRELCGDTTCVIVSSSSHDDYLIEQGKSPRGMEVSFYKKKGTGETRGVVISLP